MRKRVCYERKREQYAAKHRKRYQDNKAAILARKSQYLAANKDAVAVRQADYRERNRQTLNAKQLAYVATRREQERARSRAYYRDHPERVKANAVKRKADLIQRTPLWADPKALQRIYEQRPAGYHVDHVIPLRGKRVSGLHVESNLQYLPAVENLRKNDRFDGASP